MKRCVCITALAAWLATPAAADDVTQNDMQVVGRALSFVEAAKRKNATLIVVFDPSDPASVRQMETTLQSVGPSLKVGDRTLSAIAVDERALSSSRHGDAVFATTGVDQSALAKFLQQGGKPCFTTEIAQARAGACTVAVRSRPTVNIYLNSRNASAAGVKFATAFIMMVREL